jgi:hypothetical protein
MLRFNTFFKSLLKTVYILCYRASVTAVFNLEDGTEKEFTRIIKIQPHRSFAVSLYLIDGKVINKFWHSFATVSVTECNMQDAVKQVGMVAF